MGWEWVLLLLRLEPEWVEYEDGPVVYSYRLAAVHLEAEKPYFPFYSSLWNEYLKQESRRAAQAGQAVGNPGR